VYSHAAVETVLDVEDPYTIIPHMHPALELNEDTDDTKLAALQALGIAGVQKHRDATVVASRAICEEELEKAESAKERNRIAIEQLLQWREDHGGMEPKFSETRDALRNILLRRVEKHGMLRDALVTTDLFDTVPLQESLREALDAAVNTWDAKLFEQANLKLRYASAFAEFKLALEKVEQEEPPAEATEESTAVPNLAERLAVTKDLFLQCRRAHVPLPSDLGEIALFTRAAELLGEKPAEEKHTEEPAED